MIFYKSNKINKTMKTITLAMLSFMIFGASLILTGCSKDETKTKNETSNKNEATTNKQTTSTQSTTATGNVPAGIKKSVIPASSSLMWEGKKVTGKHNGSVKIKTGDVFVDNGKITGGSFDIDFTTIDVLDIKDAEMNAKLVNHLKSDDFFSAGSHPVGKFVISSAEPMTDDKGHNMKINGSLTIKGITNPVSFPAKVNIADGKLNAVADFKIDRTLWDIKFRSGKFYENLGDNLISDDFDIKLNIVAGV